MAFLSTLVSKEKLLIKDSQGGVNHRGTEGQRLGQKARGPVGPPRGPESWCGHARTGDTAPERGSQPAVPAREPV